MALNDPDHDRPETALLDQLVVFGSGIFGTICVVGAIGWYVVRHRSDPWTSTDFAKSGGLLVLGLALLGVAFWHGRRHATPTFSTPARPVTWMRLLLPVVSGVSLIGKGIFDWRTRWVVFHLPIAAILSILAGVCLLVLAWVTVRKLNAVRGWSRRPSFKDALDEIYPAACILAILAPERWSTAAYAMLLVLFCLIFVTGLWERRRPTGPSL